MPTDRDGPCETCGKYHDFRDDLVVKPAVHPLVAAERARIRAAVEGLADSHFVVTDSAYLAGVPVIRLADLAAVLAIIDREGTAPKRDYLADASLAALDRALDREDTRLVEDGLVEDGLDVSDA